MTDNNPHLYEETFACQYLSLGEKIILRYGIATGIKVPVKGIVFLLHGRSEFIEKYKKVAAGLQKNGFMVVSLDWRGQGLSSRELENRHKGYIHRFDVYVDDLKALYSKVIEPLGLPVYILAHSMGGHIALRFMEKYPLKIEKAVLVSPMIDIAMPPMMKLISKLISKKLAQTWLAEKYTPGSGDYSVKKARFQGNPFCHDPETYWILHNEIAKNPDLALGGITWGWLHAAFESIEILKQDAVIKRITPPILMISAQKDAIVSIKAQEKLSQKLPHCTFFSIKGAFHELLFEAISIRSQLWEAVNEFMDE